MYIYIYLYIHTCYIYIYIHYVGRLAVRELASRCRLLPAASFASAPPCKQIMYIYIYIERERDIHTNICICTHACVYEDRKAGGG